MGTDEEIVRESNPNATGPDRAAGDMGVSSERDGPTGPGQHATDGTRPTAARTSDDPTRTPPEQQPGNPEENPVGHRRRRRATPSQDPRSD